MAYPHDEQNETTIHEAESAEPFRFRRIPTIYFDEKIVRLADAIERLPRVCDQVWELQAIVVYAEAIAAEAAKWGRVAREDEKRYNESVSK